MKETSRIAHEMIKPEKPGLKQKILKGLKLINKGSFRDIADAAGLRESQVWKRLSELKAEGYITEKSIKKCPISGKPVTVWTLNDSKQLNL